MGNDNHQMDREDALFILGAVFTVLVAIIALLGIFFWKWIIQ